VLGHNWIFAIFVAVRTAMIAKNTYSMEHFHLAWHDLKCYAWPALMVFNSNYKRFAKLYLNS